MPKDVPIRIKKKKDKSIWQKMSGYLKSRPFLKPGDRAPSPEEFAAAVKKKLPSK